MAQRGGPIRPGRRFLGQHDARGFAARNAGRHPLRRLPADGPHHPPRAARGGWVHLPARAFAGLARQCDNRRIVTVRTVSCRRGAMNNRSVACFAPAVRCGAGEACRPSPLPPATLDVTFAIYQRYDGLCRHHLRTVRSTSATATKPMPTRPHHHDHYGRWAPMSSKRLRWRRPDEYHYGMAACADGAACERRALTAIDVAPGGRAMPSPSTTARRCCPNATCL